MQESIEIMVKSLSPVIPHLCHHLWFLLGGTDAIINELWPTVDDSALIQDSVQIIVQVNGKLRAKIMSPLNSSQEHVESLVFSNESITRFTNGKEIVRIIMVPNKLVNVVIK
jgi:leucyl-tRNA synthetase